MLGFEFSDGPVKWDRYMRADAFEALRIEPKGQEAQHGVVYRPDQLVFFVTLDKSKQQESLQYKDEFVSPQEFQWQSQNQTSQMSDRGKRFESQRESGLPIHLFVRKESKTGGKTNPFIYIGKLTFLRWEGNKPITIWWELEESVPQELWQELDVPEPRES